jgi:mono/diheme cytochrome c family protein
MRGFILGIIVTLLVVCGGAYFYTTTGHFDPRAVGNTPSALERRVANKSVDAWVEGHAPKQANPFQPTMANLTDGSTVYDKHCAFCHGSLQQTVSPMRRNFYPPVPQLMTRTPDDPDGNLFYVVKYGIRYTAMPGWDGALSDDDIWKTVLFIKHAGEMKQSSAPQGTRPGGEPQGKPQ